MSQFPAALFSNHCWPSEVQLCSHHSICSKTYTQSLSPTALKGPFWSDLSFWLYSLSGQSNNSCSTNKLIFPLLYSYTTSWAGWMCLSPLCPSFIYLSKSVQKSISLLTLSSIVSVEQFPSSYSKDFICTSQTTLSFGLRLCLISPARVAESLRARFESNFPLSCMYQMMGKLIDFLWGNITWYIFTRQ